MGTEFDLETNDQRASQTSVTGSPEERWVLRQCGQYVLPNGASTTQFSFSESSVDWSNVVEFACRQRIGPVLLARFQNRSQQSTPAHLVQSLETWFETSRRRNLKLTAELVRLVDLFESDGVRVLSYKGPVTAIRGYGDLSLRRFVDLDLLVPPSERQSAVELLRQQGYEQATTYEHLSETVLKHRETGILVDLHTRIVPDDVPFHIGFNELYDRRTTVDLGGQTVLTFSLRDAILAHTIHGTKHCWFRAEWVLAVAALLTQCSDLLSFLERAKSIGCERMVLLALVLSRRLFDTPFSEPINQRLEQPSRSMDAVNTAADETLQWIFATRWATDERSHLVGTRMQTRLYSDLTSKCRFLFNVITKPQQNDRELVALPDSLAPLYRVIRPLRLAYVYRDTLLR